MPLPNRVHIFRSDSRCLALVVLRKPIRPIFDQLEDWVLGSLDQRPMQSCETQVISGIDICAPPQQNIHASTMAFVRGPHQTRMALGILHVHWNVLMQKEDDLEEVAV